MHKFKTTNIKGKDYVEVNQRLLFFRNEPAYAGWYERARAALSPKASRTKSDITVQLNYLIDTNKPLHKDIRAMVNQMEVEGKDLFSTAELSRNHPELTTTQIAKLDEIQQAWRATQDTLFDITNQGEKTRLINAGYDKGIYVNKEYKGAVKQVFNLLDDEVPTKVDAPLVPVVVSVILFCFVANLVVRFNNVVSVSSIITVRSAETVPVVVIGLGETTMPVPAVIEVRLPDPLPPPPPPLVPKL